MRKIERSIAINAPVEQIWQYLSHPEHLPEIWPSIVEVKDVQSSSRGGDNYCWVYNMFGVRFEGRSEVVEAVTNERRTTRTTGGIDSKVTWKMHPVGAQTEVGLVSEYTIPVPLLGKLAEAFIVKANEHEAETILANLKAAMETQAAVAR